MKRLVIFIIIFVITFCSVIAPAAGAATRTSEKGIEAIEMPSSLQSKAEFAPLDAELYLEVAREVDNLTQFLRERGDGVSADKVNAWLVMNKKYFTNANLVHLKSVLEGLDYDTFQQVDMIEYKDPTVSLILSVLVGELGVDRFFIGDIGLGVGKLLTFGGLGIWWLIDIFNIQNATKKKNFSELNQTLVLIGDAGR